MRQSTRLAKGMHDNDHWARTGDLMACMTGVTELTTFLENLPSSLEALGLL